LTLNITVTSAVKLEFCGSAGFSFGGSTTFRIRGPQNYDMEASCNFMAPLEPGVYTIEYQYAEGASSWYMASFCRPVTVVSGCGTSNYNVTIPASTVSGESTTSWGVALYRFDFTSYKSLMIDTCTNYNSTNSTLNAFYAVVDAWGNQLYNYQDIMYPCLMSKWTYNQTVYVAFPNPGSTPLHGGVRFTCRDAAHCSAPAVGCAMIQEDMNCEPTPCPTASGLYWNGISSYNVSVPFGVCQANGTFDWTPTCVAWPYTNLSCADNINITINWFQPHFYRLQSSTAKAVTITVCGSYLVMSGFPDMENQVFGRDSMGGCSMASVIITPPYVWMELRNIGSQYDMPNVTVAVSCSQVQSCVLSDAHVDNGASIPGGSYFRPHCAYGYAYLGDDWFCNPNGTLETDYMGTVCIPTFPLPCATTLTKTANVPLLYQFNLTTRQLVTIDNCAATNQVATVGVSLGRLEPDHNDDASWSSIYPCSNGGVGQFFAATLDPGMYGVAFAGGSNGNGFGLIGRDVVSNNNLTVTRTCAAATLTCSTTDLLLTFMNQQNSTFDFTLASNMMVHISTCGSNTAAALWVWKGTTMYDPVGMTTCNSAFGWVWAYALDAGTYTVKAGTQMGVDGEYKLSASCGDLTCPAHTQAPGCTCMRGYSGHPAYEFYTDTWSQCTLAVNCAIGSFANLTTLTCNTCHGGTYSAANATVCMNCAAGKFSGSGAGGCTDCAPGKYSNAAAASCTSCPGNTYSATTFDSCTACASGKVANADHSACADIDPNACKPGSFSSTGMSPCTVCPVGKSQGGPSATSCDICPAGSFAKANSTSCTPCPVDQYNLAPQQATCTACPTNSTTDGQTGWTNCAPKQSRAVAAAKVHLSLDLTNPLSPTDETNMLVQLRAIAAFLANITQGNITAVISARGNDNTHYEVDLTFAGPSGDLSALADLIVQRFLSGYFSGTAPELADVLRGITPLEFTATSANVTSTDGTTKAWNCNGTLTIDFNSCSTKPKPNPNVNAAAHLTPMAFFVTIVALALFR